MEMGEYELAREAALQATECAPNWSDAHFALGRVYFNLGMLEEARSSMVHALELARSHVDTHGRPLGASLAPTEIEAELDEVLQLLDLKQQMLDSQGQVAPNEAQMEAQMNDQTPGEQMEE